MNILDGMRLANRSAALQSSRGLLSAATVIGAASSVLSIKQAITNKREIEFERSFQEIAGRIRRAALTIARGEKEVYSSIDEIEKENIDKIAYMSKHLTKTGLFRVGLWFTKMVIRGVSCVVLPMFRLIGWVGKTLLRAVPVVLRTVVFNPYVLGALGAGLTAYGLYRKFGMTSAERAEQEKDVADIKRGKAFLQGKGTSSSSSSSAPASSPQGSTARDTPAASVTPSEPADVADKLAAPKNTVLTQSGAANKKVLVAAMDASGMKDKRERAAFLAQMDHESAGFSAMEERGNAKYFSKYEGNKRLGNIEKGDGEKFKGRGFIQLTGRDNYARFGAKVGVDLIKNPELAADPAIAAKIALAFWESRGLGPKARAGKFDQVTKGINGGYNGKADRDAKYAAYLQKEMPEEIAASSPSKADKALAQEGLQIPTYGRLSSAYGTRIDPVSGSFERKHKGVDIAAPKGTPVYAATGGKVSTRGGNTGGYGNLATISGDVYNTKYAHLDSFDVKDGAIVVKGQQIGKVGNTGRSTGNHLHFEIADKKGKDIDPATVMPLSGTQIAKSQVTGTLNNESTYMKTPSGQLVRLESA